MSASGSPLTGRDAALLAAIVESSDDAIISADLEHRVTSWNGSAERMFGYAAAEIIGQPVARMVPDNRRHELVGALATTADGGRVAHLETVRRHKDGRLLDVSVSLSPIHGPGGAVIGTGAVIRDVSERRAAELGNAQLAAVVESSDDAIISHSLDGRIMTFNAGAERLSGYRAEEVIGRNAAMFAPEERTDESQRMLQEISEGRPVRVDTVRHRRDGRPVELSLTMSPIRAPDGRVVGISSIGRDITARKTLERELNESRTLLAAALSSMTDAVFISDENGRFIHFNEAFTTFHRFESREHTLTSLADYPAVLEVFMADGSLAAPEQWAVPRALRGEVGVGVEYGLRRRDTGERWVGSYTFAPVRSQEGAIVGSVVTARDISVLKAVHDERERALIDLKEAQRLARIGSWNRDLTTSVAAWSSQLYELFERDPARGPAFGEDLLEYVHADDRERVLAAVAAAPGSAPEFDLEFRIRTGRGAQRIVHARGGPDPQRPGSYFGTCQDVTAERESERARLELIAASARAEAANRAKSEFLARMSHELRTPLNSILGFGQLLGLQKLGDDQRESVDYILKGGRHLLELINEVLDIASIESGGLTISPEPVPIAELVRETVALLTPVAVERDIALALDTTCATSHGHVLADRNRLKQVLLNLLANAIKYNRPGGRVTVSCADAGDGRVRIAVADTGIGIRPEHLAKLFVPFERLGAEHTTVEGTGLGLALSKGLLQAMGGTIAVDTEPGSGTTFTIDLAAADGPQSPDRTPDDIEPLIKGPSDSSPAWRILYIEDNLSNLALIQHILGRHPGIELMSAMQGSIGLALAREHRPDLIVLDLHLPDMSGADVLKRLRADAPDTPVVVITADATKGQEQALQRLGANEYLTKPLDVRHFLTVVNDYLDTPARTPP